MLPFTSNQSFPKRQRETIAILLSLIVVSGCRLHDSEESVRTPAVATRFTANPLPAKHGEAKRAPVLAGLRLGLAMQSGIDPVHSQFAGKLGIVLVRELQLSEASLAVQPLATLELRPASPPPAPQPTSDPVFSEDVITVAFSDAQSTLPAQLPPNPMYMTAAPPVVDQILVVRVIEYRPYFPILATLELRVLDGETQSQIHTTTATWSGVDYRLTETKPKRPWRHALACDSPSCGPSPGHNSPQALLHEISKDISAWYTASLLNAVTEKPARRSMVQRLKAPWTSEPCDTCQPPNDVQTGH